MENRVCRTCLSSSGLNSIFPNSENHERYSTAIYITTGVRVAPNDGLPQDMCTDCIAFLNLSLQFRDKCRETQEYLLKMKENGDSKATKDTKQIELVTLDIEHIESHTYDTDKIIHEPKNEDSKVTEDTESSGVNIEIKREYLDDPSHDDDRPLTDWLGGSKESNSTICRAFIILEEEETNTKVDVKNEESEIIISKVPPRRIQCQFCSKNLSIRSLNEHIAQQHPGVDERRVKCVLCDKYVVRAKMARHRRGRHGAGDTFTCGYCKTNYDSEELLIAHVPTCTAKRKRRRCNESKLAECHICHKKMLNASLRPHIAVKHEGKGPVCEHCGRRFANNLRLSEHRRARHGHEKFKCTQCEYQCASLQTMQNHERRHRGERPFVCEACGTGFHSLHLLHQHRQSHRTEKLIKCDLCPAIFKANNSLHVHKMTCHSSTAYRCALCARTFSCKNYATRHIKHVHSLEQPASALERVDSETERLGE